MSDLSVVDDEEEKRWFCGEKEIHQISTKNPANHVMPVRGFSSQLLLDVEKVGSKYTLNWLNCCLTSSYMKFENPSKISKTSNNSYSSRDVIKMTQSLILL